MFSFSKSNLGLTNEEIATAESNEGKGGSKFMSPGVHTVKVVEADFHYKDGSCMNAKDPTWATVKVVFENAAKAQKQHYLLIPTSKLLFNEGNSKRPEFVFLQFKRFCATLGIEVEADAKLLTQVMTKYFKDPKKLIGMAGEIEIGYKGPYIKYCGKDQFQLCKPDGTAIVETIYPTKDAAILKAAELELKVQDFSEILAFLGKKVEPTKVKKEAVVPESGTSEDW